MGGISFHKHRILPGHMGGTYDASNVIRVNVAMHAFLHQQLWLNHGHEADKRAWLFLTNMIGKEEGRIQAVSESSKDRWANNPEYRAKVIASRSSPENRAAKSAKAKELWRDPAFRAKMRAAQIVRWSDPTRRAIQSARQTGNSRSKGYKHTKAARAAIGAASKSQWASFSDLKRADIIAKRTETLRRRMAERVH
jgi:hypothetical protein